MKAVKNITPLFDRILVSPIEGAKKTSSGIYIPDTAQETPKEGHVVAVGPGKKDEPMVVKVGDHVMYWSGREVRIQEEKYLIMRQTDVEAIIK